jgi:glutamate/tyrosine decarboxylase-like PLP-dependent enzyme
MDAEILSVPCGSRLLGTDLKPFLKQLTAQDQNRVFAVVATSGTTNLGIIDDLEGIAEVCEAEQIWLHVDGAYGGAGLAAPSIRALFSGIERANSFIVDPHKWLFSPFDCCALLYRDPMHARVAHRQHGDYLEVLYDGVWNPSDYAHHLSRRARGLPFWFSLAMHGTEAYSRAVETTLQLAQIAADLIDKTDYLTLLMPPNLSVVVFRREGWTAENYQAWSENLLEEGTGFVMPTKHLGETVLRFCVVNPNTSQEDLRLILDSLA